MPAKKESNLRILERFLPQREERPGHWQEAIDKYLNRALAFTEDAGTGKTGRELL